jgi:hypothetical protein
VRIPFLALLVHAACSASGAVRPVSIRDSAGIRVVENRSPVWDSVPWRVAGRPTARIGHAGDDETRQLHFPTSAVRLASGTIVVAERGNARLRFFDAAGNPLRSAGREGGGPGEFRWLWWVRRWAADSVIAYDAGAFRFSIFDTTGRFHRSVDLPGRQGYYWRQAFDLFPNGDALVYALVTGRAPAAEGRADAAEPLFRWPIGAAAFDSLGVTMAREEYAGRMGRMFLDIPLPFGRAHDVTPWRDGLLVGWTGWWELREIAAGGGIRAMLRIAHTPLPVTGTDQAVALDSLRERSLRDQVRQTVARVAADLPMASTMPAYGRWAWERVSSADPVRYSLLVDADDHIWVIQYRPPGSLRRWDVLAPDGRWLGAVTLPPGLEPFEIGSDYILGWRKDAMGIISVELYGLDRGDA